MAAPATPKGTCMRGRRRRRATLARTPALAAVLSSGDLILPVGGLTLLLTGVVAGILGYTTIGDGPANPKNRG